MNFAGCNSGVVLQSTQRRTLRRHLFTLAEVIAAFSVLTLVSIGIYGSILLSQRLILQARLHSEAEMIAMDKVWFEANRQPYAELANWVATKTETVQTSSILYNCGGTIRTAAAPMVDAAGLTYAQVTVRVDWKQGKRAEFESLSFDRYPVTR